MSSNAGAAAAATNKKRRVSDPSNPALSKNIMQLKVGDGDCPLL